MHDAIRPFLEAQGFLVLDGGLATQLEERGFDLAGGLWSAELLVREPAAIAAVHEDYFRAGADCATTASYQASLPGFAARGVGAREAERLIASSVELARAARDRFWADRTSRAGRLRPIVAASVGPFAAYLADGSEYTGEYGATEDELVDFHRARWHQLAASGADLLALETVPNAVEARAYARLFAETPDVRAWVGFCCRDEARLSDGSRLAESAAPLAELEQVVAIGVNCTAPRFVPALLRELRRVTDKPLVAYPNSGERFDPDRNAWSGERAPRDFGADAPAWRDRGAALIGGCCRTGPEHVRLVRRALGAAMTG